MVFYRKYRPQKFAEIVGQEHIKKTLLVQLETGKVGHGYLFAGPKGTGKTSTARILAKAVNCEVYSSQSTVHGKVKSVNRQPLTVYRFGEPCGKCHSCLAVAAGSHLDLIEIDAASNRGIDEIRDLREKIKLSPVQGRFRVYIIDEAHMLTNEAFNALLKTLEEPPKHVILILCTTEPERLPGTIISRLSRFNFQKAKREETVELIGAVAKSEGMKIDKEAALAIARVSEGSFRDAISILDQVSVEKIVTASVVEGITKISGWQKIYEFVQFIASQNLKDAVESVSDLAQTEGDIELFTKEVILFLEDILYIKIGVSPKSSALGDQQLVQLKALAESFDYMRLQNLMKLLLIAEGEMKLYPMAQIPLVLALCKFCPEPPEADQNSTEVSKMRNTKKAEDKLSVPESVLETGIIKKVKISKSDSKLFEQIEKKWGEFLNKVKPANAHLVALLRSTRPVKFENGTLTLEVFFSFHKEKLREPKIMDLIAKSLEEVIGRSVRFELVLAQRGSKPTLSVSRSDVVEIDADELTKVAQEIFSE